MNKYLLTLLLLLAAAAQSHARHTDHLSACWEKQVKPLQHQYLMLTYTDMDHRLTHSFQPWQTTLYKSKGTIWSSAMELQKSDTLYMWDTSYSKTQLDMDVLLFQNYRMKKLYDVTKEAFLDEPLSEAHYLPAILINDLYEHRNRVTLEKSKEFAVYTTTVNKTIIKLYIRKKDDLLEKITAMNNRDVYGDVTCTINYADYRTVENIPYPATTYIADYNGMIGDTVTITNAALVNTVAPLLTKPADYVMKDEEPVKPDITVDKYNDHIYFINLNHTNGRAMLAVFDSFLLVAEAPLNSENGELIISEARRIAPGKPIKYFVFCHYHPDYTGGMRPFIHKGTTILCSQSDSAYVQYVANAPHTLQPDSLQLQPRKLNIKFVGEHMTVGDAGHRMDIYFIGKKSTHTNDYLIYYFPKEKMLFEGDLVRIQNEGPIRKASRSQAGLYNAIKDLGLDVQTIQQSWPLTYGYKVKIPFADMEAAMQVK